FCGPGPWVPGNLVFSRKNRLTRRDFAQRLPAAGADGLAGWADTGTAPFPELILHDAVFAGVVGDHGEGPARFERVTKRGERGREVVQFAIHGDAESLEDASKIGWT